MSKRCARNALDTCFGCLIAVAAAGFFAAAVVVAVACFTELAR